MRFFSNCITLANSGSVGATFYHPYKFIASDHVTSLINNDFNKYIYLFITATIRHQIQGKYDFNREISDKRINKEMIMLLFDKNNQLDFYYMENYMKQIQNNHIDKLSILK